MINEKDIIVREFKGADSPVLLNAVCDLIFSLWMIPMSNIEGIENPQDFFKKKVDGDIDNLVNEIILYGNLNDKIVKTIIGFAFNSRTQMEYSQMADSLDMDETLLIIKVVLNKFLMKLKTTVFYNGLKNMLIYKKNTENTTNTEN